MTGDPIYGPDNWPWPPPEAELRKIREQGRRELAREAAERIKSPDLDGAAYRIWRDLIEYAEHGKWPEAR